MRRRGGAPAAAALVLVLACLVAGAAGLGSMASIAVAYGQNGPVFCGLSSDGSHLVTCFGADASIVYGAPFRLPLLGLAAGDGFVCGLLVDARQPYCWGSNAYVKMGVPQPMEEGAAYSDLSAGDDHICALRTAGSVIDCWGYNMTARHAVAGEVSALSAGSVFNCGLFQRNRTAFCWGDETGSDVIALAPTAMRFQSIAAGGFHVCGILENGEVFCWGRSFGAAPSPATATLGDGDVDITPMDPMLAVAGGRFHACGIRSADHRVACWGFMFRKAVPPPKESRMFQIAAGDYFTCGVLADGSLRPACWGVGGPWSAPMAVSPGICSSAPCAPGYYEYSSLAGGKNACKPANSRVCLPCTLKCAAAGASPPAPCTAAADTACEPNAGEKRQGRSQSLLRLQMPIFVAEVVFAVVLVSAVAAAACLYVRCRLRHCRCSEAAAAKNTIRSFRKESVKVRPDGGGGEDIKIRRAQVFTYAELAAATGGFGEESQIGKGSTSCVFKGTLRDGTAVAVKRVTFPPADTKKSPREFHTELDLLSRLNHAHLLSLLGYCEEGGERLLVYEFMAHGSLYQHLHCRGAAGKQLLNWVRRVTIAVQAARGIEYLHGYACPPVIHRDIKSSNILIDEERNARVSDFGLSLLGPADSSSPLSELPAGTLGYLDPEYYRLHYLTTKSDVYSFGVLLLEILSGRKAIDMQFEEGNIVQWAVPLIKAGDVPAMLDPALNLPSDLEALKKVATIACKCVRMRAKDRPSMDKVTTALERALALLMGSPSSEQPILPTEVVLGSSRMHMKSSQRSLNLSCSDHGGDSEDHRNDQYRAPSWITFPSVASSSHRRKSSASEADAADVRNNHEGQLNAAGGGMADGLHRLEEEIGPASPQEDLFLKHNF